jgi:hypothetical protein
MDRAVYIDTARHFITVCCLACRQATYSYKVTRCVRLLMLISKYIVTGTSKAMFYIIIPSTSVSPVRIIPPVLHTHALTVDAVLA